MKPWIGLVVLSMRIYGATSLKDRRQVTRSILESIRNRQNFSVCDLGPDDSWDRADLAFSCVSCSAARTSEQIDRLTDIIELREQDGEFEIINVRKEVMAYGDIQN